jgi:dihydrofolate reductase
MSLDGFVADRDEGVAEVFNWYMSSGDIEFHTGGSDPMTFRVSPSSAEHLRGVWSELGAILTGRRTFEVADGWNGNHAWGPAFVLTHDIPDGWPRPDSTVHFVTDGIDSAVRQAKAAAKGKSVGVHGAETIQQLLNAGLLDEIHVDIAAVLLGSGVRLFDNLVGTPMSELFVPRVGAVLSADIAVPEHEREVRFYSRVLSTGEIRSGARI